MALKKKSSKTNVVKGYRSDLDAIRKHFADSGGTTDNRFWKVPEPARGEKEIRVQVRILPPWGESAKGFFYYTASMHHKMNIGGVDNRAVPCPESVGKGKCPLCIFIAKIKAGGDTEMIERFTKSWNNSIYPVRKYWVNLIARDDPGKIWMYSGNKKFIEAILDAEEDVTDPINGRDLVIIRRGKMQQTRYSYTFRTKESPIKFNRKEMYQLDTEVVEWMSYDDMVNLLLENFGEEVKEVGLSFKKAKTEKEKIKKLKRGNPRKKKKVVEEEDEMEDEDIDIEEDAEDGEDVVDIDEEEDDIDGDIEEDEDDESNDGDTDEEEEE